MVKVLFSDNKMLVNIEFTIFTPLSVYQNKVSCLMPVVQLYRGENKLHSMR